ADDDPEARRPAHAAAAEMQAEVGGDEAEPAGVEGGEHAGAERVAEGQGRAERSQVVVGGGGEGGRSDQEGAARGAADGGQEHDGGRGDGGEERADGAPLRRAHSRRKGRTAASSWSLEPMTGPPELSWGAGASDQRASGP